MGERGEVPRLRATLEALGPALEARDRQWKAAFLSAKRDARYVSGDILRGASVPMRFAEPTTPWEEFVAPLLEGMLEPAGAPRCLKSVNSPTADDLETAGAPRVGTSKYQGVHVNASGFIVASITNGTSTYCLGSFPSKEAAARAFDEEARKIGRLKSLNFPTADDLETAAGIMRSAGAPRARTSKYHGVYISASGSITANITKNGASAYLGTFRSEEAAAKRWDEEARKLGRLKNINFPTADDLARMT